MATLVMGTTDLTNKTLP